MLIFDQLRISDDGSRLYINIHVNEASYFNNVYLDSITIMTGDKVSSTNPEMPTSDYIYHKDFEGDLKKAALVLEASDFLKTWESSVKDMICHKEDISRTLFFVYVKCRGPVSECTPCRLDEEVTVGVTFDEEVLYQRVMDYTRELSRDCSIPKNFIDFILLWNAFKASIETEHYVPAIKFYKMLFDTVGHRSITKGCGCHE